MADRIKWTLADIKAANADAGGHFFKRSTMRFFGDTMRSFAVRHRDGKVLIERVKPMRDRSGRSMGGVGDIREFNPETGSIGSVINRT